MLSIVDGLSSRRENWKNVEGRAEGGEHQLWTDKNNEASCSTATAFHTKSSGENSCREKQRNNYQMKTTTST